MTLLDRLLRHDAWTTRQLLLICQNLSDEQLDREFDIGPRSLRATMLHVIRNVEGWTALMSNHPVHPMRDERPEGRTIIALIERLDRAAAEFATVARAVEQRGGWDERFIDTLDTPPKEKTFGGAIAHLITHSMHHRAQALYMLRKLGVKNLPEGDVLTWEATIL